MPILGEIQRGKDIGKRGGYNGVLQYIWGACIDCGRERWVRLDRGKPKFLRCLKCNAKWLFKKDGLTYKEGYVFLHKPEHLRAGKKGYIKRAVLVLEQKLGRPLLAGMDSHHENNIRDDDRPENLMELPHNEHLSISRERIGKAIGL